ncbi:cell division protein FtsB [uncultured Pseudoteredinibacter sp.]|uniref:cell division protein FtsB n=1 Tax=uncultured Pseudoteredinibacter sp. TaxID=1641701 RepID=UPI002624D8BA|nr:cell division protein FtsB [uncultured Pseudoteredinibacter sp.]MCV6620787.1 cell division protein FtsB [Cellvibrionaceae bacterium]
MKWISILLLLLLLGLQYRLWVGEGSYAHIARLERELEQQEQTNERLQQRNKLLEVEVEALRKGNEAIEEKARNDMGMIKEGETFYMVVEPKDS